MEFHEVANLFPLIDGLEFDNLVNDIREHGLQQPIWTYQGKIIDGRNRYRACQRAGVEPRFQEWDGKGSLIAFTISLNVKRRHLTSSQLAGIALNVMPLLEKEAAERQRQAGGDRKSEKYQESVTEKFPGAILGEAREQAAQMLGTNAHYISDLQTIAEKKAAPGLVNYVVDGFLTVSDAKIIADLPIERRSKVVTKALQRKEEEGKRVSRAVRDAICEEEETDRQIEMQRQEEQNESLRARRIEFPDDKYSCIVIDPPWEMQKIERDVRPNQFAFDYPTMNEEELKAFHLPALAADDCHLYLWTTQKHLPLALRLAEHWGFNYQCLLTWRKNVGFTPFSWMYSTEHVLFCTKGHLPLLKLGKRLDFEAKVREHSRKPDEFYDLVKEVSPGPRIDVFSREKRDGFDQYGNEVEKYVSA